MVPTEQTMMVGRIISQVDSSKLQNCFLCIPRALHFSTQPAHQALSPHIRHCTLASVSFLPQQLASSLLIFISKRANAVQDTKTPISASQTQILYGIASFYRPLTLVAWFIFSVPVFHSNAGYTKWLAKSVFPLYISSFAIVSVARFTNGFGFGSLLPTICSLVYTVYVLTNCWLTLSILFFFFGRFDSGQHLSIFSRSPSKSFSIAFLFERNRRSSDSTADGFLTLFIRLLFCHIMHTLGHDAYFFSMAVYLMNDKMSEKECLANVHSACDLKLNLISLSLSFFHFKHIFFSICLFFFILAFVYLIN